MVDAESVVKIRLGFDEELSIDSPFHWALLQRPRGVILGGARVGIDLTYILAAFSSIGGLVLTVLLPLSIDPLNTMTFSPPPVTDIG